MIDHHPLPTEAPRKKRWRWIAAGIAALVALGVALAVSLTPSGPSKSDMAAFTTYLQQNDVPGTESQWETVAQQICGWAKDGDTLEGILAQLEDKGYSEDEATNLHVAATTTYCKEYEPK